MQETNKYKFINHLSSYVPMLLAFLMPLFFLPVTTEFFEFNKLALLTVGTLLATMLWIIRMIVSKKVFMTRTIMDLGIIVFMAAVVLSTLFSIDKTSSVFGSYGRWFPSLFGLGIIALFYFVTASTVDSEKVVKRTLYALYVGSTLATLVAVMSYFGIKLSSSSYFQVPNFTLTGSTLSTSLLAGLAVIISLGTILKAKLAPVKIMLAGVMLMNLFGLLLLGSAASWVATAVGVLATFYFTDVKGLKENKLALYGLAGILVAMALVVAVPATREVLVNPNYPREIVLAPSESKVIAFSVLRDYTILGSGPSTFYINYPNYKTTSLNATPFWNLKFDKPYSEVFNLVASLGILGIITASVLAFRIIKFVVKSKADQEKSDSYRIFGPLTFAVLAFFVFGYATVLSTFVLFLILAMMAAEGVRVSSRNAKQVELSLSSLSSGDAMSIIGERTEILPYIIAVPAFLALGYISFVFGRVYLSEVYMRSASIAYANNNVETYELQGKAINLNQRRDVYHTLYAQTNLMIANNLAAKESLTDEEKQMVENLISQAIRSSRAATEVVNPLNVSNWETRALVYRSLIGAAKDADQWAVSAYNSAILLDPTNPRLRLDLGGLYYSKQDYMNAASLFRQATSLKPDYANAHYNFAHTLIQLKSYQDAQAELELVQKLVAQDSEDYKKASEDLEEVKKLIAASGNSDDAKPSVEQLETASQASTAAETTPQEPLMKPGEEESIDANLNSTGTTPTSSTTPTPSGTPTPTTTPSVSPTPTGSN